MKRIKLFESFVKLDPNEVLEDIKVISYELEDNDCLSSYMFRIYTNGILSYVTPEEYNHELNYAIKPGDIKCDMIIILIEPIGRISDKYYSDLDRFTSLLREHLDYIDPKKITNNINSVSTHLLQRRQRVTVDLL